MFTFEARTMSSGSTGEYDIEHKITVTSRWMCFENTNTGHKSITSEIPKSVGAIPRIIPGTGGKIDPRHILLSFSMTTLGTTSGYFLVKKDVFDTLAEVLFGYKEPDLLN